MGPRKKNQILFGNWIDSIILFLIMLFLPIITNDYHHHHNDCWNIQNMMNVQLQQKTPKDYYYCNENFIHSTDCAILKLHLSFFSGNILIGTFYFITFIIIIIKPRVKKSNQKWWKNNGKIFCFREKKTIPMEFKCKKISSFFCV